MTAPFLSVARLADAEFRAVRRRAIFDCCKWDPQVEDVCTLSRAPLVTTPEAWHELSRLAESLARETLAAEAELLERPDLHRDLALPRAVVGALGEARRVGATRGAARLIRFDFHHTSAGWRISEANSDVPGGINEASGFPLLVAPHYRGTAPAGDPAGVYVEALLAAAPPRPRVALLHATSYSDDLQMMAYLARRLESAGAQPVLASPAHIRWRDGLAFHDGRPLDLAVRFFPGDWLADLPREAGWQRYYAGGRTPVSNPAAALLTQSKRWPLAWDRMRTPLPAWRSLLPETRDPREVPWRNDCDWVVKPALGRVGEDVAMAGLVSEKDWKRISRDCARYPGHWVAQRRFDVAPLEIEGRPCYPCVGVYTVDGRVAGAYGRLAPRPLIDDRAEDAAVLVGAGAA